MKAALMLFGSIALLVIAAGEEPQKLEPARKRERLKASVDVFRDGGSRVITIPAHEGLPACRVFIDWSGRTNPPGGMFREGDFHGERQGKQLAWNEADKVLQQLEKVLIAHFGAEELLKIALNPIEPGTHLTEEEYSERVSKDREFNDRQEAGYLMNEIMGYRAKHGPVGPK